MDSEVKDDLDDVNTLLEDINQISTSLGYKENQIYIFLKIDWILQI